MITKQRTKHRSNQASKKAKAEKSKRLDKDLEGTFPASDSTARY
jgi:hypothetical protein